MALKADRLILQTDISFFMNEVAERGGCVSYGTTSGSGAAMDQGAALVTYAATSSGKIPVGLLMNDMVSVDLTRQKLNPYKNEVQKGSKVTLLRKGYVVTNKIQGTAPTAGAACYVAHSGNLSASNLTSQGSLSVIGQWLSIPDQDGYAKVEVNLPATAR